jgi:pimeloyl-ACP methyl ester carboxylesterase
MERRLTLNVVRLGEGEPLVLLHPLGGELVVWEPVMPLLAPSRDVVAPDMAGFGRSPELPEDEEPTPAALARAVAALMDELGIESAHVAGVSLGGWVALELGRLGRARSVTGLNAAGFWRRPLGPRRNPARELGRALAPLAGPLLRSADVRRRLLGGVTARPERVPPDAAARLVRAYITSPGFERVNAAMRSAVFDGMEEIRAPVTLAWAEHDRLVAEPLGGVPGARRRWLRGCGHIPTWDDPEQVADVLLEASSAARRTA